MSLKLTLKEVSPIHIGNEEVIKFCLEISPIRILLYRKLGETRRKNSGHFQSDVCGNRTIKIYIGYFFGFEYINITSDFLMIPKAHH